MVGNYHGCGHRVEFKLTVELDIRVSGVLTGYRNFGD